VASNRAGSFGVPAQTLSRDSVGFYRSKLNIIEEERRYS
jgi:hypothetical protein